MVRGFSIECLREGKYADDYRWLFHKIAANFPEEDHPVIVPLGIMGGAELRWNIQDGFNVYFELNVDLKEKVGKFVEVADYGMNDFEHNFGTFLHLDKDPVWQLLAWRVRVLKHGDPSPPPSMQLWRSVRQKRVPKFSHSPEQMLHSRKSSYEQQKEQIVAMFDKYTDKGAER